MNGLDPTVGQHMPAFVTAAGETDSLMVIAAITLLAAVLAGGVFFLWLHSLPERMVHNKWQYDIVAVLGLLALFTHIHAFWVAALIIALIKLPDFSIPDVQSPLENISESLDRLVTAEVKTAESLVAAANAAPPASSEVLEDKGASKNA